MRQKRTILVAGKSGQLARSLKALAEETPGLDLKFLGRPELNIADASSCRAAIEAVRPDIVLNAAAYTDVDGAVRHADEAHAINALGAAHISAAAASRNTPVIHISTDYVFDGTKSAPYFETDTPRPVNTYGASKLEGERLVRGANPRHIILRTAWLYSPFGSNFVSKLITAASSGRPLRIVADQVGSPTSAFDLARALLALADQLTGKDWDTLSGTYHLASPEPMSRFEWARRTFAASRKRSGPHCNVLPAASGEFPTPAARPLRTSLSVDRYSQTFGLDFPSPDSSLHDVVDALLHSRRHAQ